MLATPTAAVPVRSEFDREQQELISCRIAATFRERSEAFRLLHENYVRSGLAKSKQGDLRVLPHHLLHTTTVFIASSCREMIRTATLVADGQLGLPLESTFAEEVQQRRSQGIRLGEFCCLADRRKSFARSFPVFVKLTRLMAQFARRRGIEEILIEVHPRHVRSYAEFLAFEPFGELKSCSLVCDRPAVALSLNFAKLEANRPEHYDLFFAERLHDAMLADTPISMEEGEYFSRMVDFDLLG